MPLARTDYDRTLCLLAVLDRPSRRARARRGAGRRPR